MRFPHAIEILSPTGTDAYGNPGTNYPEPTEPNAVAFIVSRSSMSFGKQTTTPFALLPPETVISSTDRIVHDGKTYNVVGDILTAASPARVVLKTATLQEVPGA